MTLPGSANNKILNNISDNFLNCHGMTSPPQDVGSVSQFSLFHGGPKNTVIDVDKVTRVFSKKVTIRMKMEMKMVLISVRRPYIRLAMRCKSGENNWDGATAPCQVLSGSPDLGCACARPRPTLGQGHGRRGKDDDRCPAARWCWCWCWCWCWW